MAINQFNPNDHITKLPRYTKDAYGNSIKVEDDYLEVKWRLVWFRSVYPQGAIETEELCVDLDREISVERSRWVERKKEFYTVSGKGYARYKAIVTTGEGGRATGTKSESAVDFPDFCEKAETGAIGRALAALGFGTQFTGDELEEASRAVDSPIESGNKKTEKQTEEDPTVKAANPSLYNAALQAKRRGVDVRMTDDIWIAMLSDLQIDEIKSGKDIASINQKITELLSAKGQVASSKPAPEQQEQVQVVEPAPVTQPVERPQLTVVPKQSKQETTPAPQEQAISEQQLRSIRKLSEYLNKPEPESITTLTDAMARTIIQQLTIEYKAARQAK